MGHLTVSTNKSFLELAVTLRTVYCKFDIRRLRRNIRFQVDPFHSRVVCILQRSNELCRSILRIRKEWLSLLSQGQSRLELENFLSFDHLTTVSIDS